MRQAQSALDEAQADRTRMLAAFAVVVGDDGSVAGMMGLQEREVRVARRTVGRDGARTVAANLLSGPPPDKLGEPVVEPVAEAPFPFGRVEPVPTVSAPHPYATAPAQTAVATPAVAPVEDPWMDPQPATVVWSPAMDSVLVWSWQSGVDLQVVANELGVELRVVLQRVQTLAADGQLVKPDLPSARSSLGRHRRYDDALVFADAGTGDQTELYPPAEWG
ncbi:hypothetical protein [Streptomyces sp. NPDC059176]|uniref:hypothetical protein n=1 Tax=unclassified Streptomyces TaxID=2593676 RepID=UPI003676D028